MDAKKVYNVLILGIKEYFKKNNFNKAVIGLSGGIDSSVSAYLVVKALGNNNVAAILMPDSGVTSKKSMNDAKNLMKKLKIKHYAIPIDEISHYFKNINKKLKIKNNVYAIANVKARARMMLLYYFANLNKALVIGTSNKTEIMLGYFTKYGDGAVDIEIIGDLFKTDVLELARFLEIPEKIISKTPSAELYHGQTDEKELGASYEVLDKILKMHIEGKLSTQEIIKKGFDKKIVDKIIKRIKLNEHKKKMPEIIGIT